MAAQIREVEQSRQEVVRSVLEVGFSRRSQSSIQIHWSLVLSGPASHLPALLRELMDSMLHLLGLNSLTCQPGGRPCQWRWGKGWEGGKGRVCKMGSTLHMLICFLLEGGSMARQTLKHPRHIYFSWIKLSLRQCQTQKRALRHLEAGKGQTGKIIWEFLAGSLTPVLEHFVTFWLWNESKSHVCCPHGSRTLSASWLLFVFFSQVASISQQPSYLDLPPAPELDWMETGQPLTFIGHQVQWIRKPGKGKRPRQSAPTSVFSTYSGCSCLNSGFSLLLHRSTVASSQTSFLTLHGELLHTCCPHCHS